jgi:hypothetical protein
MVSFAVASERQLRIARGFELRVDAADAVWSRQDG